MYVVATAGHVDHGKSTLVKRLTGQEPDRWEEEQRRGLTIDLGFVWTRTPRARDIAFVDVPGHERFLGNMLAGVGPAPAVLFVIAADEGWQEQSTDHRDAINAFGINHGLVALTRCDRATAERRARTRREVVEHLAGTTLADAPIIEVSAITGEGIPALLEALDNLLDALPAPDPRARVRMWLDRSFSITGAGTVVTGTLHHGSLAVEDRLELVRGGTHPRTVTIRGLQSEDRAVAAAAGTRRVAVNLRDIPAGEITRGDALITPQAWHLTHVVDARRQTGTPFTKPPQEVAAHIGTAAVTAQVRAFGPDHVRLTFAHPLPLAVGDRLVLRKPGDRHVYAGVELLDVAPPQLTRRGDAARRTATLTGMPPGGDVAAEVRRRGATRREDLLRYGLSVPAEPPQGIIAFAGWWIPAGDVVSWGKQLRAALNDKRQRDPLTVGLTRGEAIDALGLPHTDLLRLAVAAAKLVTRDGHIASPGDRVDLGAAEEGVRKAEEHLRATPFSAPEADDLTRWGLGPKELAAAQRAGRLVRIAEGIVLLPDAPQRARMLLAELPAPFTASQARRALDTTRRVMIPFLEYLDAHGVTRRDPDNRRRLR